MYVHINMYNYSIWLLYPVLRKLPHTHTHTHNCTIVAEVLHIFCYLLEAPLHWSSTSITFISCTYTRGDIHDQFSTHTSGRGYNKRTVTQLHTNSHADTMAAFHNGLGMRPDNSLISRLPWSRTWTLKLCRPAERAWYIFLTWEPSKVNEMG